MERVRTRGDARHQRQRHHHLFDRKLRSHGRAHRRLHHRGPGANAYRPRVPGDARRRDCRDPRDRSRDRRVEHPVRRQSFDGTHGCNRDEPACFAVVGSGVESHRLPDRKNRRQARRRLYARRDSERHHAQDSRLLRAHARLRRGKNSQVAVRKVPRRRRHPRSADEIGRRSDGHWPHLQRSAHERYPLARHR